MKRSYLFGLAAAALFGGVYMQGCGGGLGSADGGGCADDSECLTGQVCDTSTNTCLTTCTPGSTGASAAECTGNETACQAFHNLAGTVCVCTSNTDCLNGGTCDTAKGTCVSGGGTGGSTGGGCSGSNPCASGSYCDTAGTCQTGASNCTTVNSQDNCDYGQGCFNDPQTSAQPVCEVPFGEGGQCPAVSGPPSTTPGSSPVILDVTKGSTRTTTSGLCNGTIQQFVATYYDPDNDVPTGDFDATAQTGPAAVYGAVFYVSANGNIPASGDTQGNTLDRVSIDGTTATFEICNPSANTHAGVVIKDSAGNFSNTGCIPQ